MTVTAPAGFEAAGIAAGIKRSGALDLAVIVNRGPSNAAAAVFTSNRAKANPILWSEQVIADGRVAAIVLNSGGANCFTGPEGFQVTHRTAEAAAGALGVAAGDVLVCSTGLIGDQLDGEVVEEGVLSAINRLSAEGGARRRARDHDHRHASQDRRRRGRRLARRRHGQGRRHARAGPRHDARRAHDRCRRGIRRPRPPRCAPRRGSPSTASTPTAACRPTTRSPCWRRAPRASCPTLDDFTDAVTEACRSLAVQLQEDAEGASHDIAIEVRGAVTEDDAVEVGRSVARNNLFKAAIFGNDPNWGRVLAAIGTTQAPFDPYLVDVTMNGVRVCHAGRPDAPREQVDLTPRATHVLIELHAGEASATILTNDLTHDYVHENSAYAS